MLKLKGSIKISGDKSISHRALIFAALSTGKTKITNLLESNDVMSTLEILRNLGITIKKEGNKWIVFGNGTSGFIEPNKSLDCGNSGTTARLMIGAVASNPIKCTFIGDKSLSKRSMSRVTCYLEEIGSQINITKNDYLPLMIEGNDNLLPINHEVLKPSAQIKSALILAALNITGKSTITEKVATRDHTENMMKYLKIKFKTSKLNNGGKKIELNGPYEIKSRNMNVASDPSSAAFFIVAALILPGSKIELKNIALNPTRIAFIQVLKNMGGKIRIKKTKHFSGEDVGDIYVQYSILKGVSIKSSQAPMLIDEYPIISIAATQAKGKTTMKGLSELRHKESDRVKSIVLNLKKLGFDVINKGENIYIKYKKVVISNIKEVKTYGDHRIAMSFSILKLIYGKKIKIDDPSCISISYPEFNNHLKKLLVSN